MFSMDIEVHSWYQYCRLITCFAVYRNGISQNTMPTSHDDMMDLDGPLDNTFQRSLFPENFRDPFALMDPNFQHQFFDRVGSTDGVTRGPLVSHPREVREIPIEVKDSDPQTSPSGQAPVIEDVTGHESSNGLEVHETIIIDDEDSGLLSAPSAPHASVPSNTSSEPTAPPLVHVNDYDDDIEEEMIRAAIEASKKDSEGLANVSCLGVRVCLYIFFFNIDVLACMQVHTHIICNILL
jgi:hypothetical protein